jgi:hypothetical protein
MNQWVRSELQTALSHPRSVNRPEMPSRCPGEQMPRDGLGSWLQFGMVAEIKSMPTSNRNPRLAVTVRAGGQMRVIVVTLVAPIFLMVVFESSIVP